MAHLPSRIFPATVVAALSLHATAADAQYSPPPPPTPDVAPMPAPVRMAPPAPAPLPAPEVVPLVEEHTERNPLAFRADLKLPFVVAPLSGTSSNNSAPSLAAVPQLVLGLHYGRIGVGLGIGFTSVSVSTAQQEGFEGDPEFSSTQSATEVLIAPTLTVDVFQSKDGRAALYVLGAPIFGDIIQTNESSTSDLGFQFALGANYAPHENFRLGLEVGPVGHFYSGSNNQESISTVALYSALVGSFLYPR